MYDSKPLNHALVIGNLDPKGPRIAGTLRGFLAAVFDFSSVSAVPWISRALDGRQSFAFIPVWV